MLERLLGSGKLELAFQPIVHLLTGDVFGFEVFGRAPAEMPEIRGYVQHGPGELLELAHREGRLLELDHAWRRLAVEAIARHHAHDHLSFFLNVDTRVLEDPTFDPGFTRALLDRHGLPTTRVVLELTERDAELDGTRLSRLVPDYVSQGFRIALDDLGSGYSSLRALLQLRPQIIKVDRELSLGLSQDPVRQNLVRALVDFAQRSGIQLVAEGIETQDDLRALLRAGVALGQGYLIARPASRTTPLPDEVRVMLRRESGEVQRTRFHGIRTLAIGAVASEYPAIAPGLSGGALEKRFRTEPHRNGFPVVDAAGNIAGLVMRERFVASLGGRFGYALHADRPIAEIMDRQPLRVDADLPIEQVSRLATARSGTSMYDLVLVERGGRYAGIVTVQALLAATTELEIQYAAYASPLTGLPGNVVIEQKVGFMLEPGRQGSAHFVYADLDNFKAYNDVYGFTAGDELIRLLGRVLAECFEVSSFPDAFLGHLGGDDFVAVVGEGPVEAALHRVVAVFDERVRSLYAPDDLARGGLVTTDRRGNSSFFPITAVSLALVSAADLRVRELHEVGRVAAELKHRAKLEAAERGSGSGWVRERRSSLDSMAQTG